MLYNKNISFPFNLKVGRFKRNFNRKWNEEMKRSDWVSQD